MLHTNSYFGEKYGKYHKKTTNYIVELHVLCPTDYVVRNEKNINFEHTMTHFPDENGVGSTIGDNMAYITCHTASGK